MLKNKMTFDWFLKFVKLVAWVSQVNTFFNKKIITNICIKDLIKSQSHLQHRRCSRKPTSGWPRTTSSFSFPCFDRAHYSISSAATPARYTSLLFERRISVISRVREWLLARENTKTHHLSDSRFCRSNYATL